MQHGLAMVLETQKVHELSTYTAHPNPLTLTVEQFSPCEPRSPSFMSKELGVYDLLVLGGRT